MLTEELWQERRTLWRDLAARAPDLRWYAEEVGFLGVAESEPNLPEVTRGEELDAALAARHLVELRIWPQGPVYVPHSLMVYVFAGSGAHLARGAHRRLAREGRISWLAGEVCELLLGAPQGLSADAMRERLGAGTTSTAAVERALEELAQRLVATRSGETWAAWPAADPELIETSRAVSQVQASAALVSKWLGMMLIETEAGVARFFAPLLSASRIHAALRGLAAARELNPDAVDGHPAWRLAALGVE